MSRNGRTARRQERAQWRRLLVHLTDDAKVLLDFLLEHPNTDVFDWDDPRLWALVEALGRPRTVSVLSYIHQTLQGKVPASLHELLELLLAGGFERVPLTTEMVDDLLASPYRGKWCGPSAHRWTAEGDVFGEFYRRLDGHVEGRLIDGLFEAACAALFLPWRTATIKEIVRERDSAHSIVLRVNGEPIGQVTDWRPSSGTPAVAPGWTAGPEGLTRGTVTVDYEYVRTEVPEE